MLHLCQVVDILKDKNIAIRVPDQSIDTSHATGRLLLNTLGAIAQFETKLRAERQVGGITKAKANPTADA